MTMMTPYGVIGWERVNLTLISSLWRQHQRKGEISSLCPLQSPDQATIALTVQSALHSLV